jgi:hypothetical protein
VSRGLTPLIGLLVGLLPAMAHAQTDIDQGKTPAQIFASDCATCHKSPRGLAAGKGSLMLRSFLAEHYTSNKDQAAALAAYVLGAGGAESAPVVQEHLPKTEPERARLPIEEPKPPARPTRRAEKRERAVPGTAKLQPPASEDIAPGGVPSIMAEPGPSPGVSEPPHIFGRHELPGRRPEPLAVPPAPAPVVAEPASQEAPTQQPEAGPGPSAAAPNIDSGNGAPVPRDNIPD